MQVGDLVKDKNDNQYYIIIKKQSRCPWEEYMVFRVSDEHVDTRHESELEVICK